MVRGGVLIVLLLIQGCDWVFGLDHRDAPLIDARVPQPGCSGMRMLADNFDDGTFKRQLVRDESPIGNQFTVSAGALRAPMTANGYATVASAHYYDLRDDAISVEAWIDGALPPTGQQVLDVSADSANGLLMRRLGSVLLMLRRVDGVELEIGQLPYDAVAHRFWKIAQAGEVTSWLTSSDGVSFVERFTWSGLPFIGFMGARLHTSRNSPQSFTAWFDNLNGGTPGGDACPAFTLTDDFEDGEIDPQWWRTGTDTFERDGHLVVMLPAGLAFAEGGLNTFRIYDLRDGELVLEMPALLPQAMVNTFVEVLTRTGVPASFRVGAGTLVARKAESVVGAEPYDPVTQRWWRFRDADGTLSWDVSADGITYRRIGQANDVTGLDQVGVRFGIYGSTVTAVEATFDNVNVAP